MCKLDLEKAEEPEIKIANIHWIIKKKVREFQKKHLYLLNWLFLKPLTVCITTNCKILKEMGVPDHVNCLQRNLYAGQEAIYKLDMEQRTGSKLGKELCQDCILSPWLFNFYAEYFMWNARLDEAQAGIKIARRNINNLRYADDTILMAESEEEPKSLLMKVKKESEKAGLKLNIQKTKVMASSPITSWQIDGETMETVTDFILGGSQNHCRWWLQPWN